MMKSARSHSELDQMVVGIELTLVSIIQGVALTVLIETAREMVAQRSFVLWVYVLAGLLTIFVFWSRAVLHIITVIRWPLEFGHNFLYIGCALVEALSLAQLANPERWFTWGAAFIGVGWVLFVYDLRVIRARQADSAGEASNELIALVWRDQWLNILLLLPAVMIFNIGCAIAIHVAPETFLDHGRHVWLVAAQIIGFCGYLGYVVRFYNKLSPRIGRARQSWDSDSAD
jgi:hypothetical protein